MPDMQKWLKLWKYTKIGAGGVIALIGLAGLPDDLNGWYRALSYVGGFTSVSLEGAIRIGLVCTGTAIVIWANWPAVSSRLGTTKLFPFRALNTGELIIHSAIYGANGHYYDIAPNLREVVSGRGLDVLISNELAGDPMPHIKKTASIVYSIGNSRMRAVLVRERLRLVIPEAAGVSPTAATDIGLAQQALDELAGADRHKNELAVCRDQLKRSQDEAKHMAETITTHQRHDKIKDGDIEKLTIESSALREKSTSDEAMISQWRKWLYQCLMDHCGFRREPILRKVAVRYTESADQDLATRIANLFPKPAWEAKRLDARGQDLVNPNEYNRIVLQTKGPEDLGGLIIRAFNDFHGLEERMSEHEYLPTASEFDVVVTIFHAPAKKRRD
jgi:hypothetical protein